MVTFVSSSRRTIVRQKLSVYRFSTSTLLAEPLEMRVEDPLKEAARAS